MSGALGEPQVLSHADALKRVYALSLYAVDNLRFASGSTWQQGFADECMRTLGAIQKTIVLATPTVQNLGE